MDRSGRAKASIFRTPSGASELCGEHFQGGWMLGCKHASMLCYGHPESSWLECSGSDLAGEMVLNAILFARVLATPHGKFKARRRQGDADVRGLL